MEIFEAQKILNEHGYLIESSSKGDFVKGEGGGSKYIMLGNDYCLEDAKKLFLESIHGEKENIVERYWDLLPKSRIRQFEQTYAEFEQIKEKGGVVFYRGIVLNEGEPVDLGRPGVCWSFKKSRAIAWAEDIWDKMVYKHVVEESDLDMCDKYLIVGETSVDNCLLPYSIWLAGRFERPEWEVRVKEETDVKVLKKIKVD